VLAFVLLAVGADVLAPGDPFAPVGAPLTPPSRAHAFGTDDLGRDLRSAVVQGARTSLLVVLGATLLASAVGVSVGAVGGYWPGAVDDVLMRATELVQVVPPFFLAVIVIAMFGAGQDRLIVVLGLTSWPTTARIVRAQTLSLGGASSCARPARSVPRRCACSDGTCCRTRFPPRSSSSRSTRRAS
jgi:peptide/nickel transport system permease protein